MLVLLFFLGLGAVGFCVLVFSAFYSRKAITFIFWGLVATGFYVLHCLWWSWLVGIATATSASQSELELLLPQVVAFFAASLVIYSVVALIRLWRR